MRKRSLFFFGPLLAVVLLGKVGPVVLDALWLMGHPPAPDAERPVAEIKGRMPGPYAVLAQSADNNTPPSQPAIAKWKIGSVSFTRSPAVAQLLVTSQDSGNNDLPPQPQASPATSYFLNVGVSSTSGCPGSNTGTLDGLLGAMINTAASETGTNARKIQFRVLTWLTTTTGCIPNTTLVP
jgi:hypothetical protein